MPEVPTAFTFDMARAYNPVFARICDEIDALLPYIEGKRFRELSVDADAWKRVVVC